MNISSTFFRNKEAGLPVQLARNSAAAESLLNVSLSLLHDTEQNMCRSYVQRRATLAEIVACFVSVLTVIENFVILMAITNGPRSLRKPPYWFIASLAAADLLTGVEVVLAVFVPVGSSPLSRILLKGIAVVTFIISINSLLLVSLDRYLRIAHHADYERFLKRKVIIFLILTSWLLSFSLFLIAPLLGWSCANQHCCANNGMCVCKRSEFGSFVCITECSQSFVPFSKTYILSGVIYFIISIIVMVSFYMALFREVKKKTFGHRISGSAGDLKLKKRELQLAKTLIITLGVFIVCWLPVMALFVADLSIKYSTEQLAKAFDFALVPSVVNSFLNPIIYSIRLPRMRCAVKRIIFPCLFRGKNSRYHGTTWATNTSMDRSIKCKSVRRRNENLCDRSVGSSNSENGKSVVFHTRSQFASAKSLNSEASYSCASLLHPPSIATVPKA